MAGRCAGNPDLTDKQQLFCMLYAMGDNATSAYQKAYGCNYNTAMTNASRLLRKAKVRAEVELLRKGRYEAQMFGEHDIFQWYLDVAKASHHKNRGQYRALHIDGRDSCHVSKKFVQQIIGMFGMDSDVFRVRVAGEFPKSTPDSLNAMEWCGAAGKRNVEATGEQMDIGIDVAR